MGLDLAACLSELVVSFSRTAAEVAALADAGYYDISEDLLNEDKEKIIELGSFQALVDYHNNKQKDNGLSMRVYQYLADNPNYAKSEHWWTRDTTADFQPLHRTAQFETCRYESYKYIERLRQECMLRMQDIHYYWTILNCAPGEIPLNSEETKDLGIQRYQRAKLPTIREILLAWDNYQREMERHVDLQGRFIRLL